MKFGLKYIEAYKNMHFVCQSYTDPYCNTRQYGCGCISFAYPLIICCMSLNSWIEWDLAVFVDLCVALCLNCF